MFNILVVDDDRIAVNGIKKRLQLYQYPLRIYEAYDGEEAKQILERIRIHILMTDIELPLINGLDLIEIAKEKYPDIKTLVFSAYSNFEYARKAISFNAIYYLLKPVDADEFQQVMRRCLDECMKDQGEDEDTLLFQDIFNNDVLDENLIDNISFFEKTHEDMLFGLCYIKFNHSVNENGRLEEFFKKNLKGPYQLFKLDDTQVLLAVSYTPAADLRYYDLYCSLRDEWQRRDANCHLFFVCAGRIENSVLLYREIKKIKHLKELYFYFTNKDVFLETSLAVQPFTPTIDVQVVLDAIYHDIDERNYWSIKINVGKLLELLEINRQLSPMYVRYIFFDIIKRLQHSVPELSSDKVNAALERISNTDKIEEVEESIQPLIAWLLELDETQNTYNHRIVEQLLNFIHHNYHRDISLESLSEMASLSPAYTSTVFKQVTGQTITSYINAYRMEMAKKLLLETNKKLVDIYPLVGYSSLTYFCVLFKNMFGETPSQYRKKKCKGDE